MKAISRACGLLGEDRVRLVDLVADRLARAEVAAMRRERVVGRADGEERPAGTVVEQRVEDRRDVRAVVVEVDVGRDDVVGPDLDRDDVRAQAGQRPRAARR